MLNCPRAFRVVTLIAIVSMALVPSAVGQNANAKLPPQMWYGTNSILSDSPVDLAGTEVVRLVFNKRSAASILKVSFSGGRLSLSTDSEGNNGQVGAIIFLDSTVQAESLTYDSAPGFRNTYPVVQSILENVAAGQHTITAVIHKTHAQGVVTYTTAFSGGGMNYKATLVVEEWMP
jgi:hypothetical protein